MRYIGNLTFLLLIALTACDEQTSPEQRGIIVEIRPEATYSKAENRLYVPIKFTNKTSNDVDLALYNFSYELSVEDHNLLYTGENSGLGIVNRLTKNEKKELIIGEDKSVEFNLEILVDDEEKILNKKLRIELIIEDNSLKVLNSSLRLQ